MIVFKTLHRKLCSWNNSYRINKNKDSENKIQGIQRMTFKKTFRKLHLESNIHIIRFKKKAFRELLKKVFRELHLDNKVQRFR